MWSLSTVTWMKMFKDFPFDLNRTLIMSMLQGTEEGEVWTSPKREKYQEQTLGGQSKMEINPAINVLTA
jgi:hypothetical protein